LFTDSSKNVSDLKSREWNATYYCVLAIIGLAVLVHGAPSPINGVTTPAQRPLRVAATALMSLIFLAHWVMTWKCESNLKVFKTRIKTLINSYFSEEAKNLFPDD
jgi:hypothetical protein